MIRPSLYCRLLECMFTPLLALALLSQQTFAEPIKVVAPNRLNGVEGEGLLDVSNFGSFREQKLRLASDFTALPVTRRTMTGFYIRPDHTVTRPSSASYKDLVIRMSTTMASELGSVFSANYGAEVVTVFNGPLTISTQAEGEADGPRVFDQYFPFATPYFYDPAAGNLLVEVASHSGPIGSLISDISYGSPALYVAAPGADATTGFVNNIEKAMQFEFVVPEPGSVALLALGSSLAMLGLLARRC